MNIHFTTRISDNLQQSQHLSAVFGFMYHIEWYHMINVYHVLQQPEQQQVSFLPVNNTYLPACCVFLGGWLGERKMTMMEGSSIIIIYSILVSICPPTGLLPEQCSAYATE